MEGHIFTGGRTYDVAHASSDELEDLLKVYRYDVNNAGIRTDPIIGKETVMNGDTYIYNGNLYFTGDIHKDHLVQHQEHGQHKRI